MKQEKFKIIQFIRELILHVDNQLENFPKKDIELKNRIRNLTYDLLELAYKANVTSDDNNKLSGVFDAILNTYYNHILKLFWVIKDNSLAYNPTKIYIEVKDGEVQSPTIALVTENGKFNYTRYNATRWRRN